MDRKRDTLTLAAIPAVVVLGALMAWAGSQGGSAVGGWPVYALLVGLAFVIQWVVFIPSFAARTERFFDLTGSLTYISVTVLALLLTPNLDARSLLLGALVIVWAGRLGSFLFWRISKYGKDDRFDDRKTLPRFLLVWTLQGLWVTLTAAAAWVAITSEARQPIGWITIMGVAVWVAGFAVEVIADLQKTRFKADPANEGTFIRTGLWAKSRHPNYFGEILLWIGVAIVAAPALTGWQWAAMVSPLFVTLLLTKVSGIPLLEEKADERWGGQPDYEQYKRDTPVLIPAP